MPISQMENSRQKFHKFVNIAIEYEGQIDIMLLHAVMPGSSAPLVCKWIDEGVRAKAMEACGRLRYSSTRP